MASDSGQSRASKSSTEAEAAPVQETDESADAAERKAKLDEDIDAILDEIDEVLEENAEEMVRGFVQKGGQ